MRLRLDPPIPLETPKGYGLAHFIDDYGIDHEDYWGVCLTETGEWWWFKNSEVRGCENKTLGRKKLNISRTGAFFAGVPLGVDVFNPKLKEMGYWQIDGQDNLIWNKK